MDNRPIGVFDSGLGGLTAVRELRRILPGEDIVYFGDTGRVPYGSRSREIIRQYAAQDAAFLLGRDIKALMAACGTVSSVAGQALARALPLPFTGVLEPTARAAAAATHNGKIGVIATDATIRSNSYRDALRALHPGLEVYQQSCPLLVPVVESGFLLQQPDLTQKIVDTYLAPMRAQGVDTLILGCTHYPILQASIAACLPGVQLVDSGRETALHFADLLRQAGLLSAKRAGGASSFYISDRVQDFSRVAGIFLGEDVEHEVQLVDIEKQEGIAWKKST